MKSPEVEQPADEDPGSPGPSGRVPRLLVAAVSAVLISLAFGAAIGVLNRPAENGPDLTSQEAFSKAKKETMARVSREMAARGYLEGRKSGRTHGILAGGMAAESDASVLIREQWASEAQAEAAAVQSELAGMTAAPPPPTPDVPDE